MLFSKLAARLGALEGDHPDVIDYIRKNKLIPPPPVALRNKDPAVDTSTSGVSELVVELTRNKV